MSNDLSNYRNQGVPIDGASRNPGNIGLMADLAFYQNTVLVVGEVVRSGGGTYDVEVALLVSNRPVICTVASDTYATLIGVSECDIPPEGANVLVWLPTPNSDTGVIIGSYADANRGVLDNNKQETVNHMHDLESGMTTVTEQAYLVPHTEKDYVTTVDAAAQRPIDHVPGNRAWINEQGLGISILNLMLLLKATDRARLEFGILDDLVRLVSGYYQHISARGVEQIYNDGGFLTQELGISTYQWERSGFLELGKPTYKKNDTATILKASKTTRYDYTEKEPAAARKRMQCFTGYLGDIMNLFVANPDPNVPADTVSKQVKDQGLLHTHIDSSGRMVIRSAAGISFQRADRIPIPKRIRQPWDPKGTKVEDLKGKPQGTKKPYTFDDNRGRSLLMRDANAYRNAQAYGKLQDQTEDPADFYIPEEKEMVTPADDYDKQGKASEQFQKNKNKQAYFNLEDDGSIVFRDAWGSEIVMRGGSIIFSCAGQLELRTGKSIVQIAGDDVIVKAKNSIDITATEKDVRVKANVNMHLLSEGRDGNGGGILLESKSTNDTSQYNSKGEQVVSTGITFKAEKSRVLSTGSVVHLAASSKFLFDGMDANDKQQATMYIGVREFICATSSYTSISCGKGAGLVVNPRISVLAGESVYVAAGTGIGLLEGAKAWVPMTKSDLKNNFYKDTMGPRFREVKEMVLDKPDWLSPYTPTARADIQFTYRSTDEYGTNQAVEVDPEYAGSGFAVYQPAWANMANNKDAFVSVTLTKWKEYDIKETYPWPGKSAYTGSDAYIKVKTEAYIEDVKLGIPKQRSDVLDGGGKPGTTEKVGFNEYEVVQVI